VPGTAAPADTDGSVPAWAKDPLSPSGSVFKLTLSDTPLDTAGTTWLADPQPRAADQPESQPPADESRKDFSPDEQQLDSTRPIMAAAPADYPATPRNQSAPEYAPAKASPEVPAAPATWSAASLGVPAAGDAGTGPRPYGQAGRAGKPSRRKIAPFVGIAAALAVLAGAGGIYYYSTISKGGTAHAAGTVKVKHKIVTTIARGPEHLLSMTPDAGATDVNGAGDIQVVFSEPLSPTSPMPTLRPAIKGSWHVSGNTAVFVPAKGFWQHTKVRVTVPAGSTGIQSNGGGQLVTKVTERFTTGSFSEVRLEQDLAQLGYLPLTWAPATGSPAALADMNSQYSAAYDPPAGTYTWQPGYPSRLMNLWRPDAPSNVLRGAVAAFQADHGLMLDMITENQLGLIVNGSIGHRLWRAMFRALARDAVNKHGYTYAVASQHYPETLTVWHNGQVIFHHLANTGIPVRPTAVRTDPVYIRYQSQIMKGTNPDGSKYADPVAWVAYFHDGEAVHYFPRYSYGSQQSLGCVELPYNQAKWIWPYLTYGTLVTITKA